MMFDITDLFNAEKDKPSRQPTLIEELNKRAEDQNQKLILSLIDKGVGLEDFGDEGLAPIHVLYSDGNKEALEALLKKGVNIDLRANNKDVEDVGDYHTTVLMGAAYMGDVWGVEKALAHGADVTMLSGEGRTLLEIAQMGLNKVVNPDKRRGFLNVMKILTKTRLEKGVVSDLPVKTFKGFKK